MEACFFSKCNIEFRQEIVEIQELRRKGGAFILKFFKYHLLTLN